MKSGAGCTSGTVALSLIALDQHRFQTTSKLSTNTFSYVDTAIAMDYEVLLIGTWNVGDLEDLQQRFRTLLAAAQKKTGDSRSARGGKQGHQRTPAFIHALYREASGSANNTPRGGFTDVGLHTGDQILRNTAPVLVFSSLRQVLGGLEAKSALPFSTDLLFRKVLVYLGLYTSEQTIQQYNDRKVEKAPTTNAPDALLEYSLLILRSMAIRAAELSDDGVDMSNFVSWAEKIRGEVKKEASVQSELYSQQFCLPQTNDEIVGAYRDFEFDLPTPHVPSKDGTVSESEIRNSTNKNLGWLPTLEQKTLSCVYSWVKKANQSTSRCSLASSLVLRSIEQLMWSYANSLPILSQDELDKMSSVIDSYRDVLHNFKVGHRYKPLSLVELKSRELLVVWVGKVACLCCSTFCVSLLTSSIHPVQHFVSFTLIRSGCTRPQWMDLA